MSDLSSETLQNSGNIAQNSTFADALQRAKQIAAKINPAPVSAVGQKRPHESTDMDSVGPDGKRSAGMTDPYGAQLAASMGVAAAAAVAAAAPLGMGMENEEVMVPDRMVGLIIGRGGESINRLQSESGAKIQMAAMCAGDSQERVCSLCGSRAAIDRAKELIQEIIQSRSGERDRPGGNGPAMSDMLSSSGDPGHTTAEIMVPSAKVGLIIGKGGETIKQLQDKSRSRMVVIQDGAYANAPEKPLRITGDAQQIHEAKQLVFELIADKEGGFRPPAGGMNRAFVGGNTAEVTVPQAAVGVVIGKSGETIRGIQNDTGCIVQFQPKMPGREDRVCTISGTPEQINMVRMIIHDLIENVTKRDQVGPGNGFGNGNSRNGGWAGGPMAGPGGRAMGRNDKAEISLPIPASKCGFVIGKGGETIKSINTQSGAYCELDRRPPPNMNEKIFIIKGTPDQVETAKRMICEKVGIPYCPSGGPGGGFGGPMGGPGGPGGYPPQGWPNSGFPNQGVWGQQNEPGKPDGWSNYYAQFYGGQGGPGQPGVPGGQPGQQPQASPAPNVNPQTGQPDYSAQWIEYYRRMGMNAEADAIEQQAKAKEGGGPGAAGTPGAGGAPGGAPGAAQASTNGGQPDYTVQWINYYRSMGMTAEAEKLEAQVKASKGTAAGPVNSAAAAGAPAAAPGADFTDQWIVYYKSQGMMDKVAEIEKAKEQQQQQSLGSNPAVVAGGAPGGAPGGFQPGYNYSGYGGGAPGAGAPAGFGQYGGYPGAGDN